MKRVRCKHANEMGRSHSGGSVPDPTKQRSNKPTPTECGRKMGEQVWTNTQPPPPTSPPPPPPLNAHTHTHTHRRPPARKHVPLAASSSSKTSFSAFACKLCCCSMIQDMLPPSIPSSSTAARTRPISARSGTGTRLNCILRDADTHGLGQYGAPRQHAGFCPYDILRYRYYLFHADKVYCFLS